MGKRACGRKLAQHSAQEASSELEQVNDLVQSQLAAGLEERDVITTLFNSWTARLESLCAGLNDKEKTLLTKAVHAGPWSDAQRKELAFTILHSQVDRAGLRRSNQKCMHIENMIPEDIFCKLRNWKQYSQLSRASMLASVARSIAIENPDQPTLYRMVAILAYCEDNFDMAQDKVFELMDKLQTYIKKLPPGPCHI